MEDNQLVDNNNNANPQNQSRQYKQKQKSIKVVFDANPQNQRSSIKSLRESRLEQDNEQQNQFANDRLEDDQNGAQKIIQGEQQQQKQQKQNLIYHKQQGAQQLRHDSRGEDGHQKQQSNQFGQQNKSYNSNDQQRQQNTVQFHDQEDNININLAQDQKMQHINSQQLHSNSNSNGGKNHDDSQSPFLWGQDEEEHNQQQQRNKSYSHLFINSTLAKSQQILKDTAELSKKIKIQEKIEREQKYKPNYEKIKRPLPDQNIDIWQDLKKSMVEKSRVSDITKKSKVVQFNMQRKSKQLPQNVIKSEKAIKKNQRSTKRQQSKKSLIKIGRQIPDISAMDNIEKMNRMIADKIKKWKNQQKQIIIRRQQKIKLSLQKIKNQQNKQIQEQEKRRSQQRKLRVKAASQRLQKKKQKFKIIDKSSNQASKKMKKQGPKVKKSATQKQIKNNKAMNSSQIVKLASQQLQKQKFSIHWNRDQQLSQQKSKLDRRKNFSQKLNHLAVPVSKQKKLQMQIEIDKSINPLKYQLLQKRGLSDIEIYTNEKQLILPQSPKKIGKQYLKQIRQKNRSDDLMRRYMSQESVIGLNGYERNWKSPNLNSYTENTSLQRDSTTGTKVMRRDQLKRIKLVEEDDKYLGALRR